MSNDRRIGMSLAAVTVFIAAQCGAQGATRTAVVMAEAPRPIIIGQSYRIKSRVLGGTRVINVQLPDHYADGGTFPVLFLLDGGEAEDFEHIAGLARINAAYGQGQEMIVVGIEGVDRRHDLTTPSSIAADLKAAPTSGGAAAYREFLNRELKPWVDAQFRTNGRTALIGESLAGLFVLETFADQPDSFSDYISVSPSLWWSNGRIMRRVREALASRSYAGKRIWIAYDIPAPPADAAAKDRRRQHELEHAFRAASPRGLAWTVVHSREGHGTIYHRAAVEAFRALYGSQPR